MDASQVFCPNQECPARGKTGQGNIVVHSRQRPRYRCRTCRKTFSAREGTMFAGLRKPEELIVIVVTLLAYGCPRQAIVHAYVRLADYSGKIRLIMLHKPKFAGQSACSTPITCDASSIRAIDPGVGTYSLESFSTPSASVNHFMAVTEELLKHILALLPILWRKIQRTNSSFWCRLDVSFAHSVHEFCAPLSQFKLSLTLPRIW